MKKPCSQVENVAAWKYGDVIYASQKDALDSCATDQLIALPSIQEFIAYRDEFVSRQYIVNRIIQALVLNRKEVVDILTKT